VNTTDDDSNDVLEPNEHPDEPTLPGCGPGGRGFESRRSPSKAPANRHVADVSFVEEACAFAWTQFMRYQPSRERAWRAWLTVTAVHEALRLHEVEAGHLPFEIQRKDGSTFETEPPDPREDRHLDHMEAVEALSVLATVPERRRRAKERHVAGLKYEEIAEELGISRTRVHHLVTEANKAIQVELSRRQGLNEPRSPRAARLEELETNPPSWLLASIGRQRKKDGAHAMLVWRRAALAIDDYRRRYGQDLGEEPLGHRPHDASAARAFDLAQRDSERVQAIRSRDVERGRGLDRDS
jgi:RNA polymerase sigma factor (sigma-70 family)